MLPVHPPRHIRRPSWSSSQSGPSPAALVESSRRLGGGDARVGAKVGTPAALTCGPEQVARRSGHPARGPSEPVVRSGPPSSGSERNGPGSARVGGGCSLNRCGPARSERRPARIVGVPSRSRCLKTKAPSRMTPLPSGTRAPRDPASVEDHRRDAPRPDLAPTRAAWSRYAPRPEVDDPRCGPVPARRRIALTCRNTIRTSHSLGAHQSLLFSSSSSHNP